MERKVAESVLDSLSDEDYNQLHAIALNATEQLVSLLTESNVLEPTDTTRKPGDLDDERDNRVEMLRRVQAVQVAGALVNEVIADFTATEASLAVWLGASLADLGSASGSTRQAARKRWPDLGQIYRVRRWLYGQREGIFYIAELLIEARPNAKPRRGFTAAMLDEAYNNLVWGLGNLRIGFTSGSSAMLDAMVRDQRTVRWQQLGELINQEIRALVAMITATQDNAGYASSAAFGLLSRYDSVVTGREEPI